ncbi:MAG: aconitate hydratase AcnA [Alphaproteobacteria bacterium]|nr:aconitate hydratase AcnA [Alphaproteobacteria bacterium]
MATRGSDHPSSKRSLKVGSRTYDYFSLEAAAAVGDIRRLPFSLKVLLENLLRNEDGESVTAGDIEALAKWTETRTSDHEIAFRPARVLMQDFTGVPAVVDLATMRDAMVMMGGDPEKINPLSPVDLVIDHSVTVDNFGSTGAFKANVEREFERNRERYAFLRWGQEAFDNFRVVPPGTGICHQVNLEYLSKVVWTSEGKGTPLAYPDTLVGTDSHTVMVNGLAVLGWGVGGIEAEAVMLGQPISMVIPEVIGFKLTGELAEGVTATDLVLTITQMLRQKGVVSKFVEFFGTGLDHLPLADRATIGNMAPEYGATCGFFPVDEETLRYLRLTGREEAQIELVEAYAKAQGMWRDSNTPDPVFTDTLALDLGKVEPSLAGPKRPQDRLRLSDVAPSFGKTLEEAGVKAKRETKVEGTDYTLADGAVVIAAITSCTNTSNPAVMIGAGLLAKKALEKGLQCKPWVKTSLAPGSQVVTEYLEAAGLQTALDQLGFNLVGYGCTTCIGNSGPLEAPVAAAIEKQDLIAASVLSGNRNFEGRINPQVKANYLASPPLVVAYALAGSVAVDLKSEPLGEGKDGPVFLRDIWPTNQEIHAVIERVLNPEMFRKRYGNVFEGPEEWRGIATPTGATYRWDDASTYVKQPPFFEGLQKRPGAVGDIRGARLLAVLGDSVTTDHISPAGAIKKASPAGEYLLGHHVTQTDFNSYGARRGNHEVMMRGTFANIRLRNEMAPGTEGGVTRHMPDGREMSIYEAAMTYQQEGVPLVVVAGREYGTGSSRDWAAKGTRLLGVLAVIAESFERIHRSNLVGMGVLPLCFPTGVTRKTLRLDGSETIDLLGIEKGIAPRMEVECQITRTDGSSETLSLLCRIDTANEAEYFLNGGILHYVLRRLDDAA